MELIDEVRASYGYPDEYILDKTFRWLYNSVSLIRRRQYNNHLEQALLIQQAIGNLLSGKGKSKKLKTFDELANTKHYTWVEGPEEDEGNEEPDNDGALGALGISRL